jgi:putative photosynthetic complex assembly protein 2
MGPYVLPLLYTLMVWWLGTGLVLWLCRQPESALRWSLPASAAAAGASLWALSASSGDASVAGAYIAFGSAVALWGCIEVSYYTGAVTGPRGGQPCPAGSSEWRRFSLAVQASLYHELSVIATAGAVALATGTGENHVGLWTFAILWWMRWSAKLNLFLGVPNLYESFLPPRLRYLRSYMVKRRMNLLFPLSVSVPAVVVGILVQHAVAPGAGAAETAGALLLAALLALAVLEHWFFVIPLPEFAFWGWAVPRSRSP